MKHKDGKPGYQQDKSTRVVPMTLMLIVLCGFSFYLGGIFCSEKNKFDSENNQIARSSENESPKDSTTSSLQVKSAAFTQCSAEFQDYTPCTDPTVKTLNLDFFGCLLASQDSQCLMIFFF